MTIAEWRDYLQRVMLPLCLQFPTVRYYDRALSIEQSTGYSFYDALIVTAAIESGCRRLLTEDREHSRTIDGLTLINPFLAESASIGRII